MRRRPTTLAACGICIVVLAGAFGLGASCLRWVHAEGVIPSREFIAAGMKDQEKPGLAVEVQYTLTTKVDYVSDGKPVRGVFTQKRQYVRTPETIFLREKATEYYDPGVDVSHLFVADYTAMTSYDRARDGYRTMMQRGDGSPAVGKDSQHPDSNDMEDITRIESVVGYRAGRSLYWLVEHGAILDETEKIDGHKCWGVAYDVVAGVQRYVIWVDPDIGFCPRRVDSVMNNSIVRRRKTMREYKGIGYGVWFPSEVVFEAFGKTGNLEDRRSITVEDAKVVPIDPQVKLNFKFPRGASVLYDQHGKPQDK